MVHLVSGERRGEANGKGTDVVQPTLKKDVVQLTGRNRRGVYLVGEDRRGAANGKEQTWEGTDVVHLTVRNRGGAETVRNWRGPPSGRGQTRCS